jgi:hypothetical protein
LLFGLFEEFSLFDSQRIVRIDQSLGCDDQKPLMPFNSHKIACVEMKFLGDPLGNHDLAPFRCPTRLMTAAAFVVMYSDYLIVRSSITEY